MKNATELIRIMPHRSNARVCHNESNPYDNEQRKEDFNERYRLMNGMELREMDCGLRCMNTMQKTTQ